MTGFDDFIITVEEDGIEKSDAILKMMDEIVKGEATITSLSTKFKLNKHAVTDFVSFLNETGICKFTYNSDEVYGKIKQRIDKITADIKSDVNMTIKLSETVMYMSPTHVLTADKTGERWLVSWGFDILDTVLSKDDRDELGQDILEILVWNAIIDDIESLHVDGFFHGLKCAD